MVRAKSVRTPNRRQPRREGAVGRVLRITIKAESSLEQASDRALLRAIPSQHGHVEVHREK
eukprot:5133606-Pleurochrysis_carterae.AAC.2